MKYRVLCTVCARGGSKGVKGKNFRLLAGKPLVVHTIEQAIASNVFDQIVLSTDSDDILNIGKAAGADVFYKRSEHLASDTAGKVDVIRDALVRSEAHFNKQFDYIVDLDVTAPLRSANDIVDAFQQCLKDDNDNLLSGTPSHKSPYFNLVEIDSEGSVMLSKKLAQPLLRRQDSPKCYDLNGAVYIWKREVLLQETRLFLARTGLYVMPVERGIDIDTELDFQFAEFMMQRATPQ